MVIDLGRFSGNIRHRNGIITECTMGWRKPPMLPEQFTSALESKSFTNGKSDKPLVARLYCELFTDAMRRLDVLDYSNLQWGDAEFVQIARLIRSGAVPKLARIALMYDTKHKVRPQATDIGFGELLDALVEQQPPLETLDLSGHLLTDVSFERVINVMRAGMLQHLCCLYVTSSKGTLPVLTRLRDTCKRQGDMKGKKFTFSAMVHDGKGMGGKVNV